MEHEDGFDLNKAKLTLLNLVCASMVREPKFDSDEDKVTPLLVRLIEQVAERDPEFVLKLALYVRDDLNIRSTANFITALASNLPPCQPFIKKYFKAIVRLPSDWLDIAALYQILPSKSLQGKALPTALRKAMINKFPAFDAYQLGKYNRENKVKRKAKKEKKEIAQKAKEGKLEEARASQKKVLTMKQMIRQLHIAEPVQHVMPILGKKYPKDETEFRMSRLPGTFDPAKANKRMKLPTPETWETLLSAKGNKASTWEELIDHNKLPFMAMLRNLRNMILAGISMKHHRWVLGKLNNEQTVAMSRQFPFRFFSAYEAINIDLAKLREEVKAAKEQRAAASKKGNKGKEKKPKKGKDARPKKVKIPANMPDEALLNKYRDALDNAVKFATIHNVKPIRGSTVVFCCIGDAMQENCRTARGMGAVKNMQDVGVLMGLMCKYMAEECTFRIFSRPASSDRKGHVRVELKDGTILHNMEAVREMAASGVIATSGFEFPFDYVESLIRKRKKIDQLIVIGPTLIAPGAANSTQLFGRSDVGGIAGLLRKYRQEVNPDLLFVSINLNANASEILNATEAESHPNDVLISGFSDAVLKYIAERGDANQLHYIQHIDEAKGLVDTSVAVKGGLRRRDRRLDKRGAAAPSYSFNLGWSSGSLLSGSKSYASPFRKPAAGGVRRSAASTATKPRSYFLEDTPSETASATLTEAQEEVVPEETEAEIERRAAEQLSNLLAQARSGKWRTARVFISSTFADMHGERDILTRIVFPELRERCRRRRINFYDVDLRWGVTQAESEDNKAVEICLSEIDRCRPFFIGLLGGRYGWVPDQITLPNEPQWRWVRNYPKGRSITELEMFYGALRHPESSNALFYFRDQSFVSQIPERERIKFEPENADAARKIAELKQRIKASFPRTMDGYSAHWGGLVDGKPLAVGLEEFAAKVTEDLWTEICKVFPDTSGESDELTEEREFHEAIIEAKSARFVGRKSELAALTKYAEGLMSTTGSASVPPMVVAGEPGVGKSALLAKFYRDYTEKKVGEHKVFVLPHFVGASPNSSDIRHALTRICNELIRKFSLRETVPGEYKELRQAFSRILEQASYAGKVVLIIDGLNELDPSNRAQSLDWLPSVSPVKIIVSTPSVKSTAYDALRLKKPAPSEIVLRDLEDEDRKQLVRTTLWEFRKKLDERSSNNQMRHLTRKTDAGKPLYLTIACEELRVFGVYERVTEKIRDLAPTIPKLCEQVLERLEGDHDKILLSTALSIIACSRGGISERDLLCVLARKGETALPRAVWAPLYRGLEFFLRPVSASGEGQLDFVYQPFEAAVRKRYLLTRQQEVRIHRMLSYYFLVQADPQNNRNSWAQGTHHAISELPYHLTKAQLWKELAETLTSLTFIEEKCRRGMVYDLLEDLASAATATDTTWEGKERVVDFWLFVSANSHILAAHPELTFQQAANQPDASASAAAAQQHWTAGLNTRSWIEWLNKPQLRDACRMTIGGNSEGVMACAYSPDGKQIACAYKDGSLRLWDAASGTELATLTGHSNWVTSCAFAPDGTKLVSASWDGTLKLWDTAVGSEIATLTGHAGRVNYCAFSHNGARIVSASWDCSLIVWDVETAKSVRTLTGHTKPVNACAFSPDDERIVSASWDSTVRVWSATTGDLLLTLAGHSKSVRCVEFSPTGKQLVSTSVDCTIRIWNSKTGAEIATLKGHSKPVNSCAFSADGKLLVSASDDLTVKVWDALGGREVATIAVPNSNWVTTAALSHDGRKIAAGHSDCSLGIWDVVSGTQTISMPGHSRTVNKVALSPDSSLMVSASDDATLKVWSTNDGGELFVLKGHRDAVNDSCFSPDGRYVLSVSDDFTMRLWDIETGNEVRTFTGHTNTVRACAYSPDGKRVASASRDNTLRIWDPRTGEVKKILRGHTDWVNSVTFSRDGKRLLTGSWDYTIKVWDVKAGRELATLVGHQGSVYSVAFSPDGKRIISGSYDAEAKIWDAVEYTEITTLNAHTRLVNTVLFSSDGRTALTCSDDGFMKIWDAVAGTEVTSLQGHSDAIRRVSYSPAKAEILTASEDCTVKVWDAAAKRELVGHADWINYCAFSSSGQFLVSVSRDATVAVWDTNRSKVINTLQGHNKPVNGCAFSPDERRIASAGDDFLVRLWDAKSGAELGALKGHTNAVREVHYSPDGGSLVTAAWDKTVRIWDASSTRQILAISGHKDWVNTAVFSPDGRMIASGSHDTELRLWDVRSGSVVRSFCGHENWVSSVAFSADGSLLLSASYDGTVRAWSVGNGSVKTSHLGHVKRVNVCRFSMDGVNAFSGGHDRTLRVWRVSDGALESRFYCRGPVTGLAVAKDGKVACADTLGNLNFIRLKTSAQAVGV